MQKVVGSNPIIRFARNPLQTARFSRFSGRAEPYGRGLESGLVWNEPRRNRGLVRSPLSTARSPRAARRQTSGTRAWVSGARSKAGPQSRHRTSTRHPFFGPAAVRTEPRFASRSGRRGHERSCLHWRDTVAKLAAKRGGVMAQEHDLPLEAYHRAGVRDHEWESRRLQNGLLAQGRCDTLEPVRTSRTGLGRGLGKLDRAAAKYRDGEVVGFENVSTVITSDLAYTVEIESYRARVGGAAEMTPVAVRVTTVFRREDDAWKVTHRHADPITAPRPAESVIAR
jgi:hypothetical protein